MAPSEGPKHQGTWHEDNSEAQINGKRHYSADIESDEWVYPHPTDFKISEHPIDEVKRLKVNDLSSSATNSAKLQGGCHRCRSYRNYGGYPSEGKGTANRPHHHREECRCGMEDEPRPLFDVLIKTLGRNVVREYLS